MELWRIANCNMHYRFYSLDDFLECQRRIGVRRVDLFGASPHIWIDAYSAVDGRQVRRQVEAYGLEPGVFLPEFSSMRYTLGSEGISEEKTWEYMRRCFHFAAQLGVRQVVISANGFLLDRDGERRRERLEAALRRACRLAGESGVSLGLINHYGDRTDMVRTKADMKQCLEALGEESLSPAVDTASVCEAGESLGDWFGTFGERLAYVSLSNTKFDGDRHFWGDGYLNLWEIVETLEANGYGGSLGTVCMVREYLARPWKADEYTRRMLREVCGTAAALSGAD